MLPTVSSLYWYKNLTQDPCATLQVSGVKGQMARDYVSDLRDQVPRQNFENLHIKNILRLNGNHKLILFSTEIINMQINYSPR